MGDLPSVRFSEVRPFNISGVDFAGPVYTKCSHKRKATKFKSYICLFICMSTKAIHLELVSELSSGAFLAALRRFISRRGCPSQLISDNGTNFVGTANHLKNLIRLCREKEIQDFSATKGIQWTFNPPYSPHFGGLWEAAIRSTKKLLVKTTNSALLNFEEFFTLLLQVEACLNSRPLTEMSSDPSEMSALTPAHFLIGGPLQSFPEPSVISRSRCLGERWLIIQRLRQQFWTRWTREYLQLLQPRSKWWTAKPNLKIGDLVTVQTEHSSPLEWTLGRVVKLFPGADGKLRVVELKTSKGIITRPVTRLCLLPIES